MSPALLEERAVLGLHLTVDLLEFDQMLVGLDWGGDQLLGGEVVGRGLQRLAR